MAERLRIVVNKHTPYAVEAFQQFGDVIALDTLAVTPEAVRDADILIVRSETKVNEALLKESSVRFVGTVTIGTDHVDLEYLSSRGIAFASAPGCNSKSVTEYIASVLLHIAVQEKFALKGKTIGVVGAGNVGSKVVVMAQSLGMRVLQNDPPLRRATGDPTYLPLDELMDADFITLHVPLTKTGEDATVHLFDEHRIARMKPGAVLINTSRGPVVEPEALKRALRARHLGAAVLDVWKGEPLVDPELLGFCLFGTPHIAGHSLDGKVNGLRMVFDKLCEFLSRENQWTLNHLIPVPTEPLLQIDPRERTVEEDLIHLCRACYSLEEDDELLRKISTLPESERGKYFMRLRSEYRIRWEFSHYAVDIPTTKQHLIDIVKALRFQLV
ncbi:MAG: 4-phosphoerythronate dehydrogenase [bacterium]